MKAWNIQEFANVLASIKVLIGARLQEVRTGPSDLVLGFYKHGSGLLWLWFDFNSLRPSLLPWTDLPMTVPARKTPLHLFLRAHFVDRPLERIEFDATLGRVVRFHFGPERVIEARLFPHGTNLIAMAEGKSVSLHKVEPLPPAPEVPAAPSEVRDLDLLREQWRESRMGKGKKSRKHDPALEIQRQLERKQKALKKVEEELLRKKDLPFREVGQWLKTHQSLDVPAEWEPFVDKRRKLAWNIDECFRKAREVEGKISGTEERHRTLRAEIAQLEERLKNPAAIPPPRPKFEPLKSSGAEGRTLRINEELTAVSGRNAADNLKILRKARAWDYWLHLQDRPGSHVILFRNKSTRVSDAVFRQVIGWFVRLQLGAKLDRYAGEKMRVIVTECRYVRPIKGDRLGRVHYQNERILIYQVPT